MSGAEVLIILPIVAALISAFNDGNELGQKARAWWRKHWGKDKYALKATADSALDVSLAQSPGQIRQAYADGMARYGRRFNVGDDVARMQLMWNLVEMHRDMLSTCRLMLDNRMEYDPSRLLLTSDRVRDNSVNTFRDLMQRLEVQAPFQRTFASSAFQGRNSRLVESSAQAHLPSPQLSRVQTLHSLADLDTDDGTKKTEEQLKLLAERYIETLPDPNRSPGPPPTPPVEASDGYNAFCPGPVEERWFAGSLSLWQCMKCGSSISFDYNKVDRSQAFANLVFSCHLPVRSETVSYKCILCRETGVAAPEALQVFEKMELVAHLGTHSVRDFNRAGFDGAILRSSCLVP